jgi:hypothetical protein
VVCFKEAGILREIGKTVKENLAAMPRADIPDVIIDFVESTIIPTAFRLNAASFGFRLRHGTQFASFFASKKKVLRFPFRVTIRTFDYDQAVIGQSGGRCIRPGRTDSHFHKYSPSGGDIWTFKGLQ